MMYGTDTANDNTPLAGEAGKSDSKHRKWFFLNIVLSITTVGFAIWLIIMYSTQYKKEIDEHDHSGPSFLLSNKLSARISADNIQAHLKALSDAAHQFNPPSRTMDTGYNASLEYFRLTLIGTDKYDLHDQYFPVVAFKNAKSPVLQETSPKNKTYVPSDYKVAVQSGSGNIKGSIIRVPLPADGGCQNFAGMKGLKDKILVFTFSIDCYISDGLDIMIYDANKQGAAAIILVMDWSSSRVALGPEVVASFEDALFEGKYSELSMTRKYEGRRVSKANIGKDYYGKFYPFPVLSVNSSIADSWKTGTNTTTSLSMTISRSKTSRLNRNLCADFRGSGNRNKTIVVGSHLDGVSAGPGINDNGSGACSTLEVAVQLAQSGLEPVNHVRFCWWGSEENGLWGSRYYVQQLNDTAAAEIALNLNFDMLGSPNYIRGIYNGTSGPADVAPQSLYIQQQFQTYFQANNWATILTPFDGRSDYGPFIAAGIPAGGLDAGAEVLKTPEQRKAFGGFANAPYDPCYHQSCDTLDNISPDALVELGSGAAYMVQTFAMMNPLVLNANQ